MGKWLRNLGCTLSLKKLACLESGPAETNTRVRLHDQKMKGKKDLAQHEKWHRGQQEETSYAYYVGGTQA